MKQGTRDYLLGMLAGVGLAVVVGFFLEFVTPTKLLEDPKIEREALQLEYDAYRACMQSAGKTGCSMQPSHFIRYYEIKRELELDQ